MTTGVTWVGAKEAATVFGAAAAGVGMAVGRAIYQHEQAVLANSSRLVPVDTGNLRSTGHVAPPDISLEGVTGEMGYDTDYALFVHENMDAAHIPPTGPKYLEQPFTEMASEGIAAIGEAVAEVFHL